MTELILTRESEEMSEYEHSYTLWGRDAAPVKNSEGSWSADERFVCVVAARWWEQATGIVLKPGKSCRLRMERWY